MRNLEDSKVCEETVQSRNDDNKGSVCNDVESGEPSRGNLELEVDGSNDSQKPVSETSELIDGRSFQDEPIGNLMIETQVLNILVAEDLSEVTDDKIDTDENVMKELEPTILQKGELDDNISDLVNQEIKLHEYNKRMDSSDADATKIADESELHLCDENRIDPDAYSYTIDLHEESSSVTVDMHTDSMEVHVSSIELESRSSECSAEKNIVCPSEEEELNKHNNEAETSQSVQKEETQSHMPWKNDIYSQVKGAEKRRHVRCIGSIPKPKKSKASLSENQELRDELKKMRESQERTNIFMANIMSVIQNRLSQEDLNVILQAAKQATDAASAPNQTNCSSQCSDQDGREED